MRRIPRLIALLIALGSCLAARAPATEHETSRLAGFEPFIGTWAFNDAFLADNEWAREFHAEVLEWGARRNIVRLRETAHKTEPNRVVLEGFAYWHPGEDRLKLAAYNVQERFFFDGVIVTLAPDRLVKEYKVYYPSGYQHTHHPKVPGDVREFREERRLVDPDTMELTVSIRIEGQWQRWPDAAAKPFVTRRVR